MASNGEKYDSALLAILQNEGKVAPFVDVLLGFLYRRTDFFRIMKSESDNLGFPPGVACKLLMNIFKKYEALAAKDCAMLEEMKKASQSKAKTADMPKVKEMPPSKGAKCTEKSTKAAEDEKGKGDLSPSQQPGSQKSVDLQAAKKTDGGTEKSQQKPSSSVSTGGGEGKQEEEEDPEQARQRRELQSNPLTYNGAERDAYYWSQNISETDVRVKVSSHIVKGKQVKVDIQAKHICVRCQDTEGGWCVLVDGELAWDVNKEESMWTLIPGEFVHLNLEKRMERWWENVFVDEPKINTRKIDCSRPMTDLDDEAQAKIEEMMYNQRQKQMGLPQSHEQKTHDILRKAWDAEGSPFKGQDFDPSRLNVDPNGVVNFND